MTAPTGIQVENVTAWMADRIDGLAPPLDFELITGGASNLTFKVSDTTGGTWVLRRPPTGHVLASAHDMAREHRIIAALADTGVPVPPAIGLCQDEDINGADFYVMGFVDGQIVFDFADGQAYPPALRAGLATSLVDTLVDLHALVPADVGLGDLGKTEDYCARQLRRWKRQIDEGSDRELPLFHELHARLSESIPAQQGAGIVHGDFRLDNCMAGHDGTIAAVLDWELCTLGDPLADVGLLCVYWTGPSDEPSPWAAAATRVEGFWDRQQLVDRYAEVSGRDVSDLDIYIAFASWKLACILEGVYARYLGGALGSRDPAELEPFRRQVDSAAERALQILEAR